jgi:hypothetical protein
MARIDIKTAQAETTAGTWHELENVTGPFGVIPITTAVNLCIGYTTPSLALATTISVGSAFKRQVSPTGPIYIQTASTSKVSWYGALINSAVVYSSYAILNMEPALVFDFKGNYFRNNATDSTFGASITHTRASSATMVNSSGTLVTVGDNVPRTGHHIYDGSVWVNEGLLHESEARTNLLLNSATLSTQSATVSAVASTLSFTGTGTVTLSGASAAGPLVGTGTGENNRVSLTFTPTAGTLTLTVSGTVTNAQLEAGATPSSYIPTVGATATRAAEILTVPAANLPYSSTNMSIQIDGKITYEDSGSTNTAIPWRWRINNGNIVYNRFSTSGSRTGQPQFLQGASSSGTDSVLGANNVYSAGTNVPFNLAGRHGSTFLNGAHEGTLLTADTTPTSLPALSSTDLELGQLFMGTIGQFRMWDEDITDAGITEAST